MADLAKELARLYSKEYLLKKLQGVKAVISTFESRRADAETLAAWAHKQNCNKLLPPHTSRYIAAVSAMNHDELAFFTAVAMILGRVELPPFPDEE